MFARLASILLVLLATAPIAHAQVTVYTAPNLNVVIGDDLYNGTLASMSCVNVPVSGLGTIKGVQVLADVTHTWIGDLVFKVVSPANTVVTLMSRPGVAETADDGTAVGGDASNLDSMFEITFRNGGPKSAELMGDTLANTGIVCRDDLACVYAPSAGAATPGTLASFNGQASNGTWKFCAGDGGTGDTGTVQRVGLSFASGVLVVAPATQDLGSVMVGATSAEQLITLTNNGNASLSIDTLSTATPPFARTATGTCGNTLPRILLSSESCTLSYTFTPTATGPAMQSFQMTTDGVGDTGFTLTGTGTQAVDPIFKDGFE